MQDQRPFVARRVGTGRAVVGVRTGQLEDEAMEQDEKPGTLFKIEPWPQLATREYSTAGDTPWTHLRLAPAWGDVLGSDDDFEHMWGEGERGFSLKL